MTQRERDEFFLLLGRAWPDASVATVANFARRIIRAAGQHQRAFECDCSFPAPDGRPEYWTARIAEAHLAAVNAVLHFGAPFRVDVQTDPRGCTMKLAYTVAGESFERFLCPPSRGLPARAFERT